MLIQKLNTFTERFFKHGFAFSSISWKLNLANNLRVQSQRIETAQLLDSYQWLLSLMPLAFLKHLCEDGTFLKECWVGCKSHFSYLPWAVIEYNQTQTHPYLIPPKRSGVNFQSKKVISSKKGFFVCFFQSVIF